MAEYVKEFNKINFSNTSNLKDLTLTIKNKLIIIQQDISDESNIDVLEAQKFFLNVYNLLENHSETRIQCIDLLLKTLGSSKSLKDIVKSLNFLPVVLKLILQLEDDEQELTKLLQLIKCLESDSNEIDEHNLSLLIEVLKDFIEGSGDECVVNLAFDILANLAMKSGYVRHMIQRKIKTSEIEEKINKSQDLIGIKLLMILLGELRSPQDFYHILKISMNLILNDVADCRTESLVHTNDILAYIHTLKSKFDVSIVDAQAITEKISKLNHNITQIVAEDKNMNERTDYIDKIFECYINLLTFDGNLAHELENVTKVLLQSSNVNISRTKNAIKYLAYYAECGGKLSPFDEINENIISHFNAHVDETFANELGCAFFKLLQTNGEKEMLNNAHTEAILEYVEKIIARIKKFRIEELDRNNTFYTVHLIRTLHVLSQHYAEIFDDKLSEVLKIDYLPIIITKAYMENDEEILSTLFSLTQIKAFPNTKVAQLLAKHGQRNTLKFSSTDDLTSKQNFNTKSFKYIFGMRAQELDNLIQKINQKVDNNQIESVKLSDVISLYRNKINYLNDHLDVVSSSLNVLSDRCNYLQQEISVMRKLGERQELTHWCVQMDFERVSYENGELTKKNEQLASSIKVFQEKINKEFGARNTMQRTLKLKEAEVQRLRNDLSEIEAKHQLERKTLKEMHKENEHRIEQLKESLEDEKRLKVEVVNEQKKILSKMQAAEKENFQLQEVIKMNSSELSKKQQQIAQLENELREAEKIQTSIMSLMQKSTRKNS